MKKSKVQSYTEFVLDLTKTTPNKLFDSKFKKQYGTLNVYALTVIKGKKRVDLTFTELWELVKDKLK